MTVYTCTCRDPGDGSKVEFFDPTGKLGCPRCGAIPDPDDCIDGECGFSVASEWGDEDDGESD